MNLTTIFQKQAELDKRILTKAGDVDFLFEKKLMALFVELGELGNELRSFKYWSEDREPRRTKALEEAADVLHFHVSLGLELGVEPERAGESLGVMMGAIEDLTGDRLRQYGRDSSLNTTVLGMVQTSLDMVKSKDARDIRYYWQHFIVSLIVCMLLIGYDAGDLEKAYHDKNKKNHERQENGY